MSEGKFDAVGVITVGRMMFTETAQNLMDSIARFGFHVVFGSSPYWGQTLTNTVKGALKQFPHVKYVLFFDGDSVWKNEDLEDLYRIIDTGSVGGKPIDAVFPVQADRNGDKPLVYNWNALEFKKQGFEYDYSAPYMPFPHGHFGCTFIRRTVFEGDAKMPEPWLLGQPATDGTWDAKPGKLDEDTYFWIKMHQHGKVCVQANNTVIGHMQVGIRWQQGPRVVWQRCADYGREGKPYGTRNPFPTEYKGEECPQSTTGKADSVDSKTAVHYAPPELIPVAAG